MARDLYDPTQYEGVHAVGLIFARDFRWIFREQTQADFGIDAHVEVCENDQPTGRLLALQIKAGERYCREQTKEGFVYRGSPRHLRYWLDYPLPVVLVIYSPSRQQAYWQGISRELTDITGRGWKIVVPLQQRLDRAALPDILRLMKVDDTQTQVSVEGSALASASTEFRTLGTHEIEGLRDEFTLRMSERIGELAKRLWRGNMGLEEWRDTMQGEIKTVLICQYLLAKGGRNLMTQSDYRRIGVMVTQQHASLDVFVSGIAKGRYRQAQADEVSERSKLYVACGELAFEMARASRGGVDPMYLSASDGWKVRG